MSISQQSDVSADQSAYRCPRCKAHLPASDLYLVMEGSHTLQCDDCSHRFFFRHAVLSVRQDSVIALDAAAAVQQEWFHATMNPAWDDITTLRRRPWVHIGTEETARERARLVQRSKHENWYLYRVTIDSKASVSPKMSEDFGCFPRWVQSRLWDNKHYRGYDIHRYINRYEIPGSVSMMVDPRVIVVHDGQPL